MKKLTALLCAGLICGMAGGCTLDKPQEETQVTETAAPTEWVLEETVETKQYQGVELTLRAFWDQSDPEGAVLIQAAEVFEARTGAAVEIVWNGSEDAACDILQIPGVLLPTYTDRVLDLTDLATAAGYDAVSFDTLRDQVVGRCGFLAGIPQTPYVSGFYYNAEAFAQAGITGTPRTWEDFLAACAALKTAGWQPLTLSTEESETMLLLQLTQHLGAEAAAQTISGGGWQTSEGALQTAADILELTAAGYLTAGTPAGQNKLTLSNAAMAYGTNALCSQAEEAALADLSWGMFPYPGTGGAEPVVAVDSDVLAISSDCRSPQAAFDFIMLLTTGEFDQLRADLTLGIPADPGNVSPIAGAVDALLIAQVTELPEPELTEAQRTAIAKLWKGKYTEKEAFAAEMDAASPET